MIRPELRHFLHCRTCEDLFRPSAHDRAPEYLLTPDGYTEVMRDDCVEFLSRHAHHSLETLRATGGPTWQDGPPCDPTADAYWPVSNGSEQFVVQGWREGVGAPLRYRLLRGHLVTESLSVEVPEDEIRQEIDRAIFPGVAPERKITAFLATFTAVVRALDPATLEMLYEVPGDPGLTAARLPAPAVQELARSAAAIFDRGDCARIEQRLQADDAFTVFVRHRLRIAP